MKLGSFTPVLSVINTRLAGPACPTGRHHHLLRDCLLLCQVPGNQTDPLSPQDQARGRSQAGPRPRRLAGLDNFHLYAIRNRTIIPGINTVFVVF